MIDVNLASIRQRIQSACNRSRRDPGSVTIVAVTKNRTQEEIQAVVEAGIADVGENRVQEALLKYNQLSTIDYRLSTIQWHMVGHLQTNKAKDAVAIFNVIHSVDSVQCASQIDKEAKKINKMQDVLLEVKTSPEKSKFGILPEDVPVVLKKLEAYSNLNIKGLMTIAPFSDDPEKSRPYFRQLKELRDQMNKLSTIDYRLSALSMGMTDDFEVAVEEGATMVRLGRALFEAGR